MRLTDKMLNVHLCLLLDIDLQAPRKGFLGERLRATKIVRVNTKTIVKHINT